MKARLSKIMIRLKLNRNNSERNVKEIAERVIRVAIWRLDLTKSKKRSSSQLRLQRRKTQKSLN